MMLLPSTVFRDLKTINDYMVFDCRSEKLSIGATNRENTIACRVDFDYKHTEKSIMRFKISPLDVIEVSSVECNLKEESALFTGGSLTVLRKNCKNIYMNPFREIDISNYLGMRLEAHTLDNITRGVLHDDDPEMVLSTDNRMLHISGSTKNINKSIAIMSSAKKLVYVDTMLLCTVLMMIPKGVGETITLYIDNNKPIVITWENYTVYVAPLIPQEENE